MKTGGTYRGRVATLAVLLIRELGRRWLTLAFMLCMPAVFFLAMYLFSDPAEVGHLRVQLHGQDSDILVNDRAVKCLYNSVLGISVTSAFAALTTIAGRMPLMRRLRLAGYTAGQLLLARIAVLLLILAVSTSAFSALLLPLIPFNDGLSVVLALVEVGVIGLALGTVLGLVFPREFEASMIIVAICGTQLAVARTGSTAERYLLFWPPVESAKTSAFTDEGPRWSLLALGLGYALILFFLGYLRWRAATRVYPTVAGPRDGSGETRQAATRSEDGEEAEADSQEPAVRAEVESVPVRRRG